MFATLSSRSQANLSLKSNTAGARSTSRIGQRDRENVEVEADTWDSYLGSLRSETNELIAKRAVAERDYQQAKVEADAWEMRLQIALNNNCEDLVRKALRCKTDCTNRAHDLNAHIDQLTFQISMLHSQMALWGNQAS